MVNKTKNQILAKIKLRECKKLQIAFAANQKPYSKYNKNHFNSTIKDYFFFILVKIQT